jgi:hypothetical protein
MAKGMTRQFVAIAQKSVQVVAPKLFAQVV